MELKTIYFGPKGLTNASATYLADMAKELVRDEEKMYKRLTFYTTTVHTLISKEGQELTKGDIIDYKYIHNAIGRVNGLKTLGSWLREAVQAKTSYFDFINEMDVAQYCNHQDIEYPKDVKRPKVYGESAWLETLDINQRNKFNSLKNIVSIYGSFIHPGGIITEAKESLNDVIDKPADMKGSDNSAIIYKHIPTMDTDEVDSIFYTLQSDYRKSQKELNKMNFERDNWIKEMNGAEVRRYEDELMTKQELLNQLLVAKNTYVESELRSLEKQYIVVPECLLPVKTMIEALGITE